MEEDNKKDIQETKQELALEMVISNAIKIPGIKVDRKKFLAEMLIKETDDIQGVIANGPVAAGINEKTLRKVADKLIFSRTATSSAASFALGLPGSISIAASVSGDVMQFYGVALRLAQELAYLYGAKDIWDDDKVNEEIVRSQLILYCGVMFGVAGAAAGVRLLSTQIANNIAKKLPQKALTKTFWYPIVKKVGNNVGVTITKKTLTNGVVKVVPIIGGVISGAMTFASMKPMAEKLLNTLEKSAFHYTDEELQNDIEIIDVIDENEAVEEKTKKESIFAKGKEKIGGLFKKKDKKQDDEYEQIRKLKELLDMGVITNEEFEQKKKQILGL